MMDMNGRMLLLVEDEAVIAMTGKMTLEKYGYRVTVASSGEKALRALDAAPEIELILMDIDLGSGMDGTETAIEILKERNLPIVFLSSHTESEVVEKTEKITSYGYVVKNSGPTVLDASIKMAFKLFDANKRLAASDIRQHSLIANSSDVIGIGTADGTITYVSGNIEKLFGWKPEALAGLSCWDFIHPGDLEGLKNELQRLLELDDLVKTLEVRFKCGGGRFTHIRLTATNMLRDPVVGGVLLNFHDIADHKALERALEERIVALTRPLDEYTEVRFTELFNPSVLQRIQDEFALATGVASLITLPDGTPITKPSNFTYLCSEIIRKNGKGCLNCFKSDAALGRHHPDGPILQQCLSGGLWDGGASITVGNRHVANWLVGQVRDETQSEENMREYARSIGEDEEVFLIAFRKVPKMSLAKFRNIVQVLFTLANQLSVSAYQNIQQARLLAELKTRDEEMQKASERLRILSAAIEQSPVTTVITDDKGTMEYVNPKFTEVTGYTPAEAIGQNPRILRDPEKPEEDYKILWDTITVGQNWHGTFHNKRKDGGFYWESAVISPVRGAEGKITHYLAIKEDITARKLADEKIRELLSEKELILREVHHRIKNNMNTIYGILLLQAQTLKDVPAVSALQDAATRVRSMMLLYTKLYQASDINRLSVRDYLDPLIDEILRNFPNIATVEIEKNIEDFILEVRILQPLGIILNELLTNIMKYAFAGRDKGRIIISAFLNKELVSIIIEDNGNGMPENVDFTNSTGFGLVLVAGLTKQILGSIRIERIEGTRIILEFER